MDEQNLHPLPVKFFVGLRRLQTGVYTRLWLERDIFRACKGC